MRFAVNDYVFSIRLDKSEIETIASFSAGGGTLLPRFNVSERFANFVSRVVNVIFLASTESTALTRFRLVVFVVRWTFKLGTRVRLRILSDIVSTVLLGCCGR